jgi:hypothetical protein
MAKRSDLKRLLQSQLPPEEAQELLGKPIVPPKAGDWLRKTGIIRENVPEPIRRHLLPRETSPELMRALSAAPDEADEAAPPPAADPSSASVIGSRSKFPQVWLKAAVAELKKDPQHHGMGPTDVARLLLPRMVAAVSAGECRKAPGERTIVNYLHTLKLWP